MIKHGTQILFMKEYIDMYQGLLNEVKDEGSDGLIVIAMKAGHNEIVEYLLKKGVDPNT